MPLVSQNNWKQTWSATKHGGQSVTEVHAGSKGKTHCAPPPPAPPVPPPAPPAAVPVPVVVDVVVLDVVVLDVVVLDVVVLDVVVCDVLVPLLAMGYGPTSRTPATSSHPANASTAATMIALRFIPTTSPRPGPQPDLARRAALAACGPALVARCSAP